MLLLREITVHRHFQKFRSHFLLTVGEPRKFFVSFVIVGVGDKTLSSDSVHF